MAQESAPEVDESSAQGPKAEPSAGNTRRGLLLGAGLLGVAGVVAACGGDDDGGDETAQPPAGGNDSSAPAGGGAAVLAKTSDIPVGGGKIFKDKKVVVTQPTQGTFKAFSTTCSHQGCPVDSISGGTINCPCHGSKYKISDASVVGGPAPSPLKTKEIKVEGENITLA